MYGVTTHHLILTTTVRLEDAICPLRLSYAAPGVQHRRCFLVRHQTTVKDYVLLAAGVEPVFSDCEFAQACFTACGCGAAVSGD